MKIAVVGDRNIDDWDWTAYHLDMIVGGIKDSVTLISGGSKGIDTFTREWAESEGYDFILIKPYHMIDNKMEYSPRFFFTRNKQIIDNADYVLIMGSEEESGVKHALNYCRKRKKDYTYIPYREEEVL